MKRDEANLCYLGFLGTIILALMMNGCATTGKSVAMGGAIGAGTGAVLGGIVDPGKDGQYRTRNVIIGGALGGVAGMIAGAAIHGEMESQKEDAYQKGKASVRQQPQPGTVPNLRSPKVEAHWVESKIIGNRYVEGHFEYVIAEPTRWEDN